VTPTILVVEDESDLVWLMRYNLERQGYQTFFANNGRAALELLEEHRPGLILLDLMLPVMDGWSFLEALAQSGKARPRVIVVSARTGSEDKVRAQQYVVDAFIAKPFDMDELLGKIRELLPPNTGSVETDPPPQT
jgi:DNA-binding response OmpR family regulator